MKTTRFTATLLHGLIFSVFAILLIGNPAAQAVPSAAREWNEELLAAIRRNVPNPPGHARNLHHVATAMYDAWAAYDTSALGYVYNERISPLPGTPAAIEAARHEAISYAAYRVLRSRFASGAGSATSLASFDAKLATLGYSTVTGQGAATFEFRPDQLQKNSAGEIIFIKDPFGNSYAYSTTGAAYEQSFRETLQKNPFVKRTKSGGFNSTYDLWSTGGVISAASVDELNDVRKRWVKNW